MLALALSVDTKLIGNKKISRLYMDRYERQMADNNQLIVYKQNLMDTIYPEKV